jgi:hypothetical protein
VAYTRADPFLAFSGQVGHIDDELGVSTVRDSSRNAYIGHSLTGGPDGDGGFEFVGGNQGGDCALMTQEAAYPMDSSELWATMRFKVVSLHAAVLKSNIMVAVPFGNTGTAQAAEKPSIKLGQDGQLWLASSNASTWDTAIATLTIGDVYTVVLHARGGSAGALTHEAFLYDEDGTLVNSVSAAWDVGTTTSNNVTKWGNSGGGNTTGLNFLFSEMTVWKTSTNPGPCRVEALDPDSTAAAGVFAATGAASLHAAVSDVSNHGFRAITLSSTSASTAISSPDANFTQADVGAQIINHACVTQEGRRIASVTDANNAVLDATGGVSTSAGTSAILQRRANDADVSYAESAGSTAGTMELGFSNLSRVDSDDEIHTLIAVMIQRHTGSSPTQQLGIKSGGTSSLLSVFPNSTTAYNRRRSATSVSATAPSHSLDPATAARWTAAAVDAATLLYRDNDSLARPIRATKMYVTVVAAQIPPAGGGSLTVGQALETDSALTATGQKDGAAGIAVEGDTPLPVSGQKASTAGLPAETDSALVATGQKAGAAGIAVEGDTPLPVTGSKAHVTLFATEVDSAPAASGAKTRTTGLATSGETPFAASGSKAGTVGLATEGEVALPVEGSGSATVGIAIETNTALGVAAQKVAAVGLATTGETVFPVSGVKILTAGMGLEFDIALPVSSSVPSASNLSMLIDGEFKSRTLEMFTELGWVPTEWEVL